MNRLRSLLFIREGEGRQISFYLVLFACLGAAMAVGKGSADAMFLKRYGIEYLPVMYLILSGVLAVTFTAYAAFVDRIAPEKFFFILLTLQIAVLVLFWLIIVYAQLNVIYPAYYILYELVSDLILVHATFYIGRNLNTLQSKRLMPLVFSGYQAGMIAGGMVLAVVIPVIGVNHAVLVWALFIATGLLLLAAWHKKHGTSPHFIQPPKLKVSPVIKAGNELKHGLRFMNESALLKNASFAMFFMVVMFYALTFSVNKIYSEQFQSEESLTAFFGLLLSATNITALVLQVFVAGRFIEKFGVSRTKLVFPLTSIISFIMMLFSPGFYTALVASFSKDSVMPAFRNPTRQMFFNVLPDHMQGRARATSVALVLPMALFVCGLLILSLQQVSEHRPVIMLGLLCALIYFLFCYRMGGAYIAALIDNLREKLYLPKDADYLNYCGASQSVFQVLLQGLNNTDSNVCLSHARLLARAFPEQAVDAIVQRLNRADIGIADQLIGVIGDTNPEQTGQLLQYMNDIDDHCRATIYRALFSSRNTDCGAYVECALQHAHPRVRAAGIFGIITRNELQFRREAIDAWRSLLDGDIAAKRCAIELIALIRPAQFDNKNEIIETYSKVITRVLEQSEEKHRRAIYHYLADWSWPLPRRALDIILKDTDSLDPQLRSAVTGCLVILEKESERQTALWKALGDGHAKVRKSALDALNKHLDEPLSVYYGWLLINKPGSSRAQKEIMAYIVEVGLSAEKTAKIVDAKIRYASEILSVMHTLEQSEQTQLAAGTILKQALEERLLQILDLALMGLEPGLDRETVAVIRAGISSRDKRQQANAREALQTLRSDGIADSLNYLIEKDYSAVRRHGLGRVFSGIREALEWCVNGNDFWLSECGNRTLREAAM